MANIHEDQGPLPGPTPTMERLQGSADARGTDYEFKMAALLALRLRRRGARFQMFSNAGAALPFDDLVVRVLGPAPALLAIQLKHKHSGKQLTSQAFVSSSGDFGLHKYFKLYKEMHSWHDPQRQTPLTADQQLLCETPLQDVWFVIYTPAALRGAAKRPAPSTKMPFEDELQTDTLGHSVAFDDSDKQVWGCMSKETAEVQQLFQGSFLPRLRLLCHQATVDQLDAQLEAEMNAAFGRPLPRSDWLTEQLLRRFKAWAQDNPSGEAVADVTGLLGAVVGEDLRRAGRAAAGGGALRFQPAHCSRVRKLLQLQRARGAGGCLLVRTRGVPQGHRAAKLLQLLEEEEDGRAAWAERWVYVGDRELREFPHAALEAALGAARAVVVDAERQAEAARALLAAAVATSTPGAEGRCLHVVVTAAAASDDDWELEGLEPRWEAPEEDWALEQLTVQAQDALLDATVFFQGAAMRLRDLEPSWPSLREDADGALLSALARGGAALGAAPPAPPDAYPYLPRTLEHPAALDPAVLWKLDPKLDHIALSAAPRRLLELLKAGTPPAAEDDEGDPSEENWVDAMDLEDSIQLLGQSERWTLLSRWGEQRAAEDEAAFRAACAARAARAGRAVHWVRCVSRSPRAALAWRASHGEAVGVAPFVRAPSAACVREPTCVHAAEAAAEDALAWGRGRAARAGLLAGEPGMGKSRFLQHLAAQARARAPRSWAVLVQALAHRQLLQAWPPPEDLRLEHAVDLLLAAAGAGPATGPGAASARRFLEAALTDSGAMAVFVDGVDEVCPAYKDKLLAFLRILEASRTSVLWVSTRLEVEEPLSAALGCPAARLRPLSDAEQERFLSERWAAACSRPPADLAPLAREAVQALRGVAGADGGRRSLLDVPLRAQMAAEGFEAQARDALREARGLQLRAGGVTVLELYRRFVDGKRELFRQRYGLKDACFSDLLPLHDDFDELHQNCAMLVLVSDGALGGVDARPFREFVSAHAAVLGREKRGLLWLGAGGEPRFAHYSFADFFAACWLLAHAPAVAVPAARAAARAAWGAMVRGGAPGARALLEWMLCEALPLHRAVLQARDDDGEGVRAALAGGAAPDEEDRLGRTALHVAAGLGRVAAVDALLAAGASFERRDALLRWTPLRYCGAAKRTEAAERLLRAGADPAQLNVPAADEDAEGAEGGKGSEDGGDVAAAGDASKAVHVAVEKFGREKVAVEVVKEASQRLEKDLRNLRDSAEKELERGIKRLPNLLKKVKIKRPF